MKLVLKLFSSAAETHVDRSIDNPNEFVKNNVLSTLNLLNESLNYFEKLVQKTKKFILINISTDEVFGSLNNFEKFNEGANINPIVLILHQRLHDHIVRAWHKTYDMPVITIIVVIILNLEHPENLYLQLS